MSSTSTITSAFQSTIDPPSTISSFLPLPTTGPDPSSTAADPAPAPATTTNSPLHTSTITATRIYTFTLPGGQTTVVSTVEESRVLSTSDPVVGSRFSHNTGAIIGVAVSATVGVILSVFVVFLSCTRYRSREEHHRRRYRRQQSKAGFVGGGRGWNAFSGSVGRRRGDLPPIPSGPIPTSPMRRGGRDRMDSSANILGGMRRTPDGEYEEEEKVWRPPLAEDDDDDKDGDEGGVALGEVVRGASPTGRDGGGYGFASVCLDGVGVGLPTPPDSGEDGKGRSSHGHSQSRGHTSSGHGHGCGGVGVEGALLGLGSVVLPPAPPCMVTDSGIGIPAQAPCSYPAYGYLPAVGGYPGPGPAYGPLGGGAGVGSRCVPAEVAPVSEFGTYVGMMGAQETEAAHTYMHMHTTPGEVIPSDNTQQQGRGAQRDRGMSAADAGEAVKGAGELVTPGASEGEHLGRSSDGTTSDVAGGAMDAAGLERGTGSGSSKASKASRGTAARVDSRSTSSRSRRSLKEVLNRFRRSSKEVSSGGAALAGPVPGAVGAGGTITHVGAETRPGYDYGAIVRPHQRQMVLERAFGHHHHQPQLDGAGNCGLGLAPPPPVILVDHAQGIHFPLVDTYPPLELAHAPAPSSDGPSILINGPAYELQHVDVGPNPYGRSIDDIDNEEESLDPRGNVVRDKLLDPFFLSPSAGGSSPNIEGASLRDYVDYSRRIGGMVKNRVMSTTTFDTVDHDQDGASVSVGTLS
ncbi:hypothetical protein AX14_001640 [Amanita brunnescens Koide BX004]|nr:hypothetical protein AX14_001640 [Amanita brunnescens Koide BX004]